jgi:transposase
MNFDAQGKQLLLNGHWKFSFLYRVVQKSPYIGRTSHDTVTKLIEKFKKTGSVADQSRNGRPRTSTMKAQLTWCWQRLQGVPKEAHGNWLQKAV